MPDSQNASDDARRSRREVIWQATMSWGAACLWFVVVQALRPRFISIFNAFGESVDSGFIPLTEPAHDGCHLKLGTLYRIMHNLTVPYVMILYVVGFVAAFLWMTRNRASRFVRAIFEPSCLIIHAAFLGLWVQAVLSPMHVFEVRIGPNSRRAATDVTVTSRYAETEGVTIDPAKVPEDLRELIPLGKRWAIGDDVERDEFQKSVPLEKKKAFVDAVWPKLARVEEWCSGLRDRAPVPDEVMLFDMMAEAAAEVYYEVYPKGPDGSR